MSNFNEEMEKELSELNLGGKIVPISEEGKGIPEDYAKLEASIEIRTEENRRMMEQSIINAKQSLPVGIKLNYMSATTRIEPVSKIPANSSRMEELGMSIIEKCRQNDLNNHIFENNDIYYASNGEEHGPVKKLIPGKK